MKFKSETCEMMNTRSNTKLDELNSKPHGGKFFEILLIVQLASKYILPRYHFTISNFVLVSFMSQITSILNKGRKLRSKRQK